MQYALGYNPFHKLQTIGVHGTVDPLVTYGYKNNNGRLKRVSYANGDRMEAMYNRFGQLITETWFNAANEETHKYRYTYDGQGTLVETIDTKTSARYKYMYEDGRLLRVSQWDNNLLVATVIYEYDENGKLEKKRIRTSNGEDRVYSYSTGENGASMVEFQVPMAGTSNGQTTVTAQSETDAFGRKVSDLLQFDTGTVSRQFSYHTGAVTQTHRDHGKVKGDPTTHLVSCIALSGGRTLCYTYDGEERIVQVEDSELGITSYEYDSQGQLIRESFQANDPTIPEEIIQTTYDGYGNILTKNGVSYGYSNSSWKDLLTSYGSDTISYDAQGNPVTYRGHALTWEKGRQLRQITNPGVDEDEVEYNYTYTYNANGIRTSKTVDGVTHTYVLDGAKILQEKWGNHTLVPLYDAEESVCGIVYNGETYFFQKNLQGDVIGIVNSAGTTVVKYSYDAWGKCNMYESSNTVGTINPYRYRGYYYDTETGWYYLQSRYYDPTVGRFINGDSRFAWEVDRTVFSTNNYHYCNNDPVNQLDESGRVVAKILIRAVIGAIFGGAMQYLADVLQNLLDCAIDNKKVTNDVWTATSGVGDYLSAIVSGACDATLKLGVWKSLSVSFAATIMGHIINCFHGSRFNFAQLVKDLVWGALLSMVVSSVCKKVTPKQGKNLNKYLRSKFKTKGTNEYRRLWNSLVECIEWNGYVVSTFVNSLRSASRRILDFVETTIRDCIINAFARAF